MRLLATSDIHGDTSAVKRLSARADKENVDVVLLCGDLTVFDSETKNMVGPFMKPGRYVMIIPGNHESNATTEFLAEKYQIINIHGYGVHIGHVGFFGCGGANTGPNVISEMEVKEYLERSFQKVKDCSRKVMMTHMHPAGSESEKFGFEGSKAVRDAIKKFKPDIHVFGHIHEAEGSVETIGNTLSMNVGKKGKIIEL